MTQFAVPYPDQSAWPGDYQAGTLTGRYVGADGSTYAGKQITITMPVYVIDPNAQTVVVPASILVTLDEDGFFSVDVPSTDDPQIQPVNWTYEIEEQWEGGRSFAIPAPAGVTTDITQVAPQASSLGTMTFIGPRGEQGISGVPGVTPAGDWSAGITYEPGDVAYFSGSSYICLLENTGLRPDVYTVYWQLFAQGGTNGLPGTADLGPVILTGTPNPGDSLLATDSTHAVWGPSPFPPGMLMPFGGPIENVPAGWLVCDGSLINRTTFAALFAAIGTTHGPGDGVSTFNLPDLGNRFPLGADDDSLVGVQGGTAQHNHSLTDAAVAAHAHALTQAKAAAHTHSVPALALGAHTHNLDSNGAAQIFGTSPAANLYMEVVDTASWDGNLSLNLSGSTGNPPATAHGAALTGKTSGLTAAAGTASGVSGSTAPGLTGTTDGSTAAVNGSTDPTTTLPPYLGLVYVIKT